MQVVGRVRRTTELLSRKVLQKAIIRAHVAQHLSLAFNLGHRIVLENLTGLVAVQLGIQLLGLVIALVEITPIHCRAHRCCEDRQWWIVLLCLAAFGR